MTCAIGTFAATVWQTVTTVPVRMMTKSVCSVVSIHKIRNKCDVQSAFVIPTLDGL